jgi:SAM-dependent methyltransferase
MSDVATSENLWGYAKRLRFVQSAIEAAFPGRAPSGVTILDVGCGSGTQLGIPLAEIGYRLTGIDSHKASIELAQQLSGKYPNAHFTCGRVEDVDRCDFDVVILSEVLEHVAEPEDLLRASLDRLSADGLAIVTVPNGYGEFEWDSWAYRKLGFESLVERYIARRGADNPASSTENQQDRHIQFFTLPTLRRMFDACGVRVVDQAASSFVSGPFAGHILSRFSGFVDWNARTADRLPLWLSSGWFFALRRNRREVGE